MRCPILRGAASVTAVVCAQAWALNGSSPLQIGSNDITGSDWRVLELYTAGNNVSTIAEGGSYTARAGFDGIGAYTDGSNVRVLFNHEATPASVSFLDLNRANVQAWLAAGTTTPASAAVTQIGRAYTSVVGLSGTPTPARFCSSTLFEPNRFGAGRGFASRAYMTGEENAGGSMYAIDTSTRTMYQLGGAGGLPTGSWENVAEVDTGRTDKIGLLMFEDLGYSASGTAPLRLWIGNKSESGTFLQKNGLASGTTYYWTPSSLTGGTAAPSRFTQTGNTVAGTWSTSATNAMKFSKLEDGTVSPHDGTLAGFNCEDQGTFSAQMALSFNADGSLNTSTSAATIKLLLEEARDGGPVSSFNNQDNLTWSTENLLFTQEDGDTQDIWRFDPTNPTATAQAIAHVLAGGAGESSGIVDVSSLFGYTAGSILLTDTNSGTLSQNQLVLMMSPNATLVPEPTALLGLSVAGLALLGRRRAR